MQVFNRFENKYIVTKKVAESIRNEIETGYMRADVFNKNGKPYPISSIYFAKTEEIVDRIKAPFEKHDYNQRLRLRTYGQVGESGSAFLEIKKKVAGLTNKRRVTLEYKDAVKQLTGKHIADNQVIKEIEFMQKSSNLKPYLLIAYDRLAYKGIEDSDLRISFDRNIRYRAENLDLTKPTEGKLLLDSEFELMEIKSKAGLPFKMVDLLNKYKVIPRKFSKFTIGAIDMNSNHKIIKKIASKEVVDYA